MRGSPVLHASLPPSACACLQSPVLQMLSGKQVRSRSWLAGTLLASFATEHQVDREPSPGRSVPVPSPNALGHLADWAALSTHWSNPLRSLSQQAPCRTGWNKESSLPSLSHWLPATNTDGVQIP